MTQIDKLNGTKWYLLVEISPFIESLLRLLKKKSKTFLAHQIQTQGDKRMMFVMCPFFFKLALL